MRLENTKMPFAITYRWHWCGPCTQYEDTKEETTIKSDGSVVAKRFDHHGAKGRFRVVERASAHVSPESAEKLYDQLMDLLKDHDGITFTIDDATHEIILTEPGIKITVESGLLRGELSSEEIIQSFLAPIELEWEPVYH